jgi:hypothetical protein
MLDACVNQAAGLSLIAAQNATRVIAMASHGDQRDELPLLWSLCSTLVDFGYSVAVLDATTAESTHNPGLEQLLNEVHWSGHEGSDQMPWSVIPAAHGLANLSRQALGADHALHQLGELFPHHGILVIYAPTGVLVSLLPDSGLAPLLAVSSAQQSLVTAYQAIKQLLLDAKLRPTVASIMPFPVRNALDLSQAMSQRLRDCAMTYLGYQIDDLLVPAPQPDVPASDEMSRLSLRLLENAKPLFRGSSAGTWGNGFNVHDQLLGSH